jgi:putative glutamine amidotransferase
MAAVAPMLDGWLLPGGEDIPASYWGDDNHAAAVPADGTRFESERALFAALDPRTPIFGICYGSQCLNVLHGGSLDQHVPDRVGHNDHATGEVQTYDVVPGTALAGLVGSQALGKSYHHQAVGRLGDGLVVNATYADGTIEGVEGTGPRWMIGVQWHPERTPDDPGSLALLRSFVAAAAEYRADRAKLSHIP